MAKKTEETTEVVGETKIAILDGFVDVATLKEKLNEVIAKING